MDYLDRFVSYFAMLVGTLICFGPAILAWLIAERKSPEAPRSDDPTRK